MIGDLLRAKKDVIVQRWVEAVLSTYPEEGALLFAEQQDPFANPVGHSVREGTAGLFASILEGMDPEEMRRYLDQIVRVRAVQQFPPSQALAFVFSLKPILRSALSEVAEDPRLAAGLADLDRRIDRVGLLAFDVYSECREEVSQLRINEVKRQVAWVLEKLNRRDRSPVEDPASPDGGASMVENEQRGDL